jgi:hypothetical protein
MSLNIYLTATVPTGVFSTGITHNLGRMAREAGIYEHLWRPDELGVTKATELIEPLQAGLSALEAAPDRFRAFNAPNGWGKYEDLVEMVKRYLEACREYPEATIHVSR